MPPQFEVNVGKETIFFETGSVARQANGAILARQGDTVVIVTAVSSPEPAEGKDYFPLTVDYREKAYAAGKIPGGYFKREGRPSEKEILVSRLMDRPLRPLFPDGYFNEVQVIALVLSADQLNDPDILAMNSASAALVASDIPFLGPIGAVRVGYINNEFVINPTIPQMIESTLNLIVAGTAEAILMVESGSNELDEEILLSALDFAHENIQKIVSVQNDLQKELDVNKQKVEFRPIDENVYEKTKNLLGGKLLETMLKHSKKESYKAMYDLKKEVLAKFEEESEEIQLDARRSFDDIEKKTFRKYITESGLRTDGRKFEDIRKITPFVGVLPRTHGSSLFTRGETQALVTCTLGTWADEQRIDDLEGESFKSFMLHYNFPPFCVGEVSNMRGPGRREIGHGALAERALKAALPNDENFPYTVRIVSDILESNGSSSMATVCGGTLAMMDAGIPIKAPIAGIAMGLIKEDDKIIILSDILGAEDHLGDMDFKVAGSKNGITALQMDIKITGINREVMKQALAQAKEGRIYILEKMLAELPAPRENVSIYAPRIITYKIKTEKIKDVIGPGGKMIRKITEETGCKIEIDDTGSIQIASPDQISANKALEFIKEITQEPEIGMTYKGKVRKITDFGAFVEILPGIDGLVHISQLSNERVRKVTDIL
ncbi:polyribonucleotide nucleotidyltransferase, partial [bacterium]|nr:polyribonucleotide nucleotidyltransferase [bacterium]